MAQADSGRNGTRVPEWPPPRSHVARDRIAQGSKVNPGRRMEGEHCQQMNRGWAFDVLLSRRENANLLLSSSRPCSRAHAAGDWTHYGCPRAGHNRSCQRELHARNSSSHHNNSTHQTSSPTKNETTVGGPQCPKIHTLEHWCLCRGGDRHAGIGLAATTFSRGRSRGQAIREAPFARLLCKWDGFCDWYKLVGMENGAIRKMAQSLVASAGMLNYGQSNWLLAYENARKQALSAGSHAGHSRSG